MTTENLMREGQFDLFDIAEVLWKGKWLIVISISICLVLNWGYLKFSKPVYTVSIPVSTNMRMIGDQQLCDMHIECLELGLPAIFMSYSEERWESVKSGRYLSLKTDKYKKAESYIEELSMMNDKLTQLILKEAMYELEVIETELSNELLGTERAVNNLLNAKRTIMQIQSGSKALSFGSVAIKKTPRPALAFLVSIFFGAVIGSAIVLFRNVAQKRFVR
ncbi:MULTISPECIES: Wzz/FepE/Etk N-terminal domain-containing protein [unclassified Neptuniibacter]|uniref:Wzz/FepE/Etk N-terminal domain-containing protein n=1 Tax=unclassified Neptuniibacter TaxID=2630693 RepID=UPI000C54D34D|nr:MULTISPECIES: Wzz/FepE/Etk N-terminal domain-containing protein [unclassified Neptuniibacter]MAY42207.1 hypothetical protein [Oceanospirillaceae bacterium]|tara:strand:+ start:20614 stop:21273 length:660 start_codon:yes stop_codon:yes gene_type:complete